MLLLLIVRRRGHGITLLNDRNGGGGSGIRIVWYRVIVIVVEGIIATSIAGMAHLSAGLVLLLLLLCH